MEINNSDILRPLQLKGWCSWFNELTHWGRVTHICFGKLTTIGSDNGLSPGRRRAIIWTNAGIMFIGPLGTNFSKILIEMYTFSFENMHLKMASGKWRPSRLGLSGSTKFIYRLAGLALCYKFLNSFCKQMDLAGLPLNSKGSKH